MRILILTCLLFVAEICIGQKPEIVNLVMQTNKFIDKSDELNERIWKLAKKIMLENDLGLAKERAFEIMKLAEESKKEAELAEKKADETEVLARKLNCDNAAAEADDAEDYCRHNANYTYEMIIYARKAANETDISYLRNYMAKVVGYAEDAYESVKNARLELEDVVKDLQECK